MPQRPHEHKAVAQPVIRPADVAVSAPHLDTEGKTMNNTDIVRDIYAAFGQGRIADILGRIADTTTFVQPGGRQIPWAGVYSTPAEVGAFFRKLDAAVAVSAFEPEQYVESGDTVVAMGRWAGTAKPTGKPYASTWSMTWKLKDGKVYFYEAYEDTAVIAEAFN
jgi:ketosteroid isomerase-like protein